MATQNKEHLNAYVVNEIGKGDSKREIWTRVGTLFPFENSEGYHLVIPDGISVSGTIVVRPAKKDENK